MTREIPESDPSISRNSVDSRQCWLRLANAMLNEDISFVFDTEVPLHPGGTDVPSAISPSADNLIQVDFRARQRVLAESSESVRQAPLHGNPAP